MPTPRAIGGTGFVSLGDYLDANQGTLQSGLQNIQGQVGSAAQSVAGSTGQAQMDAAGKAQELQRGIGSEAGLAGKYGLGPGAQLDAALEWGAFGPQLQGLSGYLNQYTPGALDQQPPPAAPKPPPEPRDNSNRPPRPGPQVPSWKDPEDPERRPYGRLG